MHLELDWSLIFTSHLNFRFSKQQWLFTIRAKNMPSCHPLLLSSCPPAFHFSFRHTGPWRRNATQARGITSLNYFYSISHLSGLMTDSRMKKAEAEITSFFSRCSGQCEKGWWMLLRLLQCWCGCQHWRLVALLQPSCLGFNFSAKNGAFLQQESKIVRCPLKYDFTQ